MAAPENRLVVLEFGGGKDDLDEMLAVGEIRNVGGGWRRILAHGFGMR